MFHIATAMLFLSLPAFAQGTAEPPPGFRALLGGSDLSGWWGCSPSESRDLSSCTEDELKGRREASMDSVREQWGLADGELACKGGELLLTTVEEFSDFELRGEWQASAWMGAGVVLRGVAFVELWGADKLPPVYQASGLLFEQVVHYGGQGSGGLRTNAPWSPGRKPLAIADRPEGEWNELRVVMVADRASVWLNGDLVVDHAVVEDPNSPWLPIPERGPIQLSRNNNEVRWRNLFVREIERNEARSFLKEAAAAEGRGEDPWPSLEPFVASRLWPLLDAYCGSKPGERATPEKVQAAARLTLVGYESYLAGQEAAAMFSTKRRPIDDAALRPSMEAEKVAWFQTVPFVMQALAPLWDDDTWDEADLALAGACAEHLAGQPEGPTLEFTADGPRANRESLDALRSWFLRMLDDDAVYATMVMSQDDGPWRPLPKDLAGEQRVRETAPLGAGAEIRLLAAQSSRAQYFDVVSGDEVLHRMAFTEVPDNQSLSFKGAAVPLQLGDRGWRVRLRFGVPGDIEVLTLYLDSGLRPLFYFCSW